MCRPTYCYQLLMRLQRRSCSSELDRPNFYYQESLEICYINENPTINHTIHRDFRKDVQVVLSSRCRPGMSRERVARGIRGGITFRVAASTLLHQASPSTRPCGSSGDSSPCCPVDPAPVDPPLLIPPYLPARPRGPRLRAGRGPGGRGPEGQEKEIVNRGVLDETSGSGVCYAVLNFGRRVQLSFR